MMSKATAYGSPFLVLGVTEGPLVAKGLPLLQPQLQR
jgi:hypothetical protein